jgi:Holliday junction resolvase
MLERDITRAIVDYLKLRGCWVYKVHGSLGARPGVPDLVCCWRGKFIAIEVKVPQPLNTPKQIEGHLNLAQRRELNAIARAGGMALVVHDVDDVIRALEVT